LYSSTMVSAAFAKLTSVVMVVPAVALQVHKEEKVQIRAHEHQTPSFGNGACPCVGIAGLVGTVNASIDGPVAYPADVGSSCKAWDEDTYPTYCTVDNSSDWCADAWCYVDPCDCSIGTNPSPSSYFPDATYEGKKIFYSYKTCGGNNTFNEPPSDEQKTECEKDWDADKYGLESCPCVGIDGLEGFTDVYIGKTLSGLYPADIGASCQAWDEGKYPGSCDGNSSADWCSSAWCYVDNSSCTLPANSSGPYSSGYLPNGSFSGKPLFYSYVTCSTVNTYDDTRK